MTQTIWRPSKSVASKPAEPKAATLKKQAVLDDVTAVGVAARELLERFDIWTVPGESTPLFLGDLRSLRQSARGAPRLTRRTKSVIPVVWLRIDNREGGRITRQGALGKDLAAQIAKMPDDIRAELKAGTRCMVLDWSHEGRAVNGVPFRHIREALAEEGIAPANVVILSQNLSATIDDLRYKGGHADDLSIVNVHHHLTWLWMCVHVPGDDLQPAPPIGFALDSGPNRSRRYVCLNWHLRPIRALLVARLRDRPEPGYISFSSAKKRVFFDFSFWKLLEEVSPPDGYARNEAIVRALLESDQEFDTDPDLPAVSKGEVFSFPNSWLRDATSFIVTETEMKPPTLERFTEKSLKAIVAGLPFVIFGNRGTIRELRAMGFDTHDSFVDHSYDLIEEPADRFEAAWQQVERLLVRAPVFTPEELEILRAAAAHNQVAFRYSMAARWILEPMAKLAEWSGGV